MLCNFKNNCALNRCKICFPCLKKLGFQVKVKWECQFRQELTTNSELKSFVESLKFNSPLEPRQAFFGGRTNDVFLHKEVNENEDFHHVDFTSLYPWTNKYCEIPIQHPEILTSEALINHSPRELHSLAKLMLNSFCKYYLIHFENDFSRFQ